MDKKFLWSNAAFYVSLAVCLVAVAVGGWFLLFGREEPPAQSVFEATEEPVQSAPAKRAEPPAAEVIETLLPEEIAMPEIEVEEEPAPVFEATPVEAEPPRLIVEPLVGEVVAAFSVSELQYDPTFEDCASTTEWISPRRWGQRCSPHRRAPCPPSRKIPLWASP